MLSTAIPTFITVITKDKDRSVVMATLQSLNEVLKSVKSLIVDEQGHPDAIANAARTVLVQKVGWCSVNQGGFFLYDYFALCKWRIVEVFLCGSRSQFVQTLEEILFAVGD